VFVVMISVYKLTWKSSVAAFGLLAGFLAPIAGSILSVISWFRDPVWHSVYLHHVATSLFALTIPLLLLGAHCLDLLDQEKSTDKQEQV